MIDAGIPVCRQVSRAAYRAGRLEIPAIQVQVGAAQAAVSPDAW